MENEHTTNHKVGDTVIMGNKRHRLYGVEGVVVAIKDYTATVKFGERYITTALSNFEAKKAVSDV